MPPKPIASAKRRSRRLARLNPDASPSNEDQLVPVATNLDVSQASTSSCSDRIAPATSNRILPLLQADGEISDLHDASVADLIQTATESNETESLFSTSSSNGSLPTVDSSPNTSLLVSNIQPSTSGSQHVGVQTRRARQVAGRRTISLRSHRNRRAPYMMYNRSIPSSLSAKVESYCDCPKTSRDLTCSCGEEDTGIIVFYNTKW